MMIFPLINSLQKNKLQNLIRIIKNSEMLHRNNAIDIVLRL